MTFKVKVKWGKEVYPDVELLIAEPPMVFKAQVFALTGVQPSRQKIMVKGATIKDDSWSGAKIRDGSLVLMMGSKDEDVPEEPQDRPKFLEDMSEAEMNTALELPVGLRNLGNTCYLNAVIQALKSVPEIHEAIKNYRIKVTPDRSPGPMLTAAIQEVFRSMDSGKTAIPMIFVSLFRTTFPRFAEQGEGGKYLQQDASECWTELVRMFQEVLSSDQPEDGDKKFSSSLIDRFLCGELSCSWECAEPDVEETKVTCDKFQLLSCHIRQDVKYLHTGLQARMKDSVSKKCEKLDRDAVFNKISTITRLPAYLTVEMVRFFFKEKERVNAKILKDVKFPIILDVFELCSPELQKKLLPMRTKHRIMEEQLAEEEKCLKRGQPPQRPEDRKKITFPSSFPEDDGSNNSGFYQLQAVVTHQGRTSSSGHYVGWVRFKGNEWLKCDDDDVTAVTEEDILKLSGGGDWHTAYILVYGSHRIELDEDSDILKEEEEKKPSTTTEEKMDTN